jgi:signal transduction histidine kinase
MPNNGQNISYNMRSSYKAFLTTFNLKETIITIAVLLAGLLLTFISIYLTRQYMSQSDEKDFQFTCNEIGLNIDKRLDEHAQLLRSGAGLFAVSDTVTRDEWKRFNEVTNISKYLPGIEGFGYTIVIKPGELNDHIVSFRKNGYGAEYTVYPEGKRDIYTSIIYLEPFNERNKQAFGYDMFSEPVRHRAMQMAMDSNSVQLSGKVILVQEKGRKPGEDLQPGVLMYVPVYKKGMPISTIAERRKAIKGWVYSPYRMRDLMGGIRKNIDTTLKDIIRIRIYDEQDFSEKTLLYDSYRSNPVDTSSFVMSYRKPIDMNGKMWYLVFTGRNEKKPGLNLQTVILVSGIIISLLLFLLAIMQINSNVRSRQIQQLNKELEKLNSDKDRFIAVLSHDLKSPFTSILGFLELITSDIRQFTIDEIESHIKIINDAARNFYNLLEDLLMWARAHSGKIPFQPSDIPVYNIFKNVMNILEPVAGSKSISVTYQGGRDVMVYADADMLKAIMRNLISNAIKFTRQGGYVKVTSERQNGNVVVSIADNGVGIKPERLERLFDISKIQSTAGTSNEKGSGLGLVLCREFVEKHGGEIEVISEYGKGSEFLFTLPAARVIDGKA